ncbi:MAG: flavodoxin [Candidatus Atribacteria bacterium]|nr:MAG: flavodoxin [Candidatus Atribacteria bacterium]
MKVLIIYHSEHHGNTKKIAKAMAEKINADILKAADVNLNKFEEYDIVGFGSGVYNGKLHKELSEILSKLSKQDGKKAFIFSTTGSKTYSSIAHERFRPMLEERGFEIIGEFSCLGFDTALTKEGINKGRPNKQDIKDAEDFIVNIIKK